jgi:hypothetical protein
MNFAFELQKDKGVREDEHVQSLMIVSLWDMLRTRAFQFVESSQVLAYNDGILDCKRHKEPSQIYTNIPPIKEHLQSLRDQAKQMGLTETWLRCLDALTLIRRKQVEVAALSAALTEIRFRFQYELQQEIFLQLRREHRSFYIGKKRFLSAKVLKHVPELRKEDLKARRCFALEEYTAAAFHLIRIMELLVQRFAGKVPNVTFDPVEDSWGNILGRCREEINKWNRGHPHHQYKKIYNSCCDLMNGLRPERNELVHHGQNYSEDSVTDLKGHVESSIKAFLKLPTLPIIS